MVNLKSTPNGEYLCDTSAALNVSTFYVEEQRAGRVGCLEGCRWMFSSAERALTLPALLGHDEHHDEGDCPKASCHIHNDIHLVVDVLHLGFQAKQPTRRPAVTEFCNRRLYPEPATPGGRGACRHVPPYRRRQPSLQACLHAPCRLCPRGC